MAAIISGPGHHATAVFTADYWEPLITLLYLLAVSALGSMVIRRLPRFGTWRQMTGPKIAMLLVLIDSYVYVFIAALLTLGIGTSRSSAACGFGIYLCITLYAATKLFITFFLIERIHIVHGGLTPRRKSRLYIFNLIFTLFWVVLLIVFLSVPNSAHIRDSDGSCVYHLNHSTTFAAAGLDVFLDAYFSLMFAIPLYRGKWSNPRIRWIAIKSLIASLVSMTSSISNLLVIGFLHGKELSWLCLASCTLDTVANASILFYITKTGSARETSAVHVTAPSFLRSAPSCQEQQFPSTILRPLTFAAPYDNQIQDNYHINPYYRGSEPRSQPTIVEPSTYNEDDSLEDTLEMEESDGRRDDNEGQRSWPKERAFSYRSTDFVEIRERPPLPEVDEIESKCSEMGGDAEINYVLPSSKIHTVPLASKG